MNDRIVSLIAIIVVFVVVAPLASSGWLGWFDKPPPVKQVAMKIEGLPPTEAGIPSSAGAPGGFAGAPRAGGYIGGTKATGRVVEVYLKVGEGVFLAVNQAPESLRNTSDRWVDVQFPDLLASGVGAARAFVNSSQAGIQIGDVVEVKFAHGSSQEIARYFPVKELTRVTALVSKRDGLLAREYESLVLARLGGMPRPDT